MRPCRTHEPSATVENGEGPPTIDQGRQPEKPERILREDEVEARTGVSRWTRARWEDRGLFPKRIHLTPNGRLIGWMESEVEEWIRACAAARPGDDS